MAALNFPDSPAFNDTFVSGGITWQWNGVVWNVLYGNVNLSTLLPSQSGNDGKVLSTDGGTPMWVDGGALIPLGTVTVSGVTVTNQDNMFDSTYKNYRVVIKNLTCIYTGKWQLRFRTSGPSDYTTGYTYDQDTRGTHTFSSSSDYLLVGGSRNFSANPSNPITSSVSFDVHTPYATGKTYLMGDAYTFGTYGGAELAMFGGSNVDSQSFTGFSLWNETNGTLSCEISLYGYAEL